MITTTSQGPVKKKGKKKYKKKPRRNMKSNQSESQISETADLVAASLSILNYVARKQTNSSENDYGTEGSQD